MYNQEVFFPPSFVIFVLNDLIYHFMGRPLWRFAVDSPVLNNVVLIFCDLSLLEILRVLSGPSVSPATKLMIPSPPLL